MVGRVGATKGREHVEAPNLEVVTSKDDVALPVEMAGQSRHSREDLERGDVDVRKGPLPATNQPIDFVFHRELPAGPEEPLCLDIKSIRGILILTSRDKRDGVMDDSDDSIQRADPRRGGAAGGTPARSFGEVATQYERYRPGPPEAAVEWILPGVVHRAVDLGAGTGALTRVLISRAEEVIAVEPDDRMRSVLSGELSGIRAVNGSGESMPIPDGSVDAVIASSSWHWMDPIPTLHEVARVLVPGGVLGVLWSGPDPDGPFLVNARQLLGAEAPAPGGEDGKGDALSEGEFATLIQGDGVRPPTTFAIPPGLPFDEPERTVFAWDVPLNADDLIGLLGTFSWVILMPDVQRRRLTHEARRLLRELLGVEGETTVDVTFRAEVWRTRRRV
jgi:SAM-dependent methyltransferase